MHIYREVVLDLVGLGYDVVYNTFHTYSVTFDFAFFFFSITGSDIFMSLIR